MSSITAHLLTPRDWQAEAVAHAARECGTPEGRRALAEAARYGALADRLAELQAEIERITEAGRAHVRRAAAFEAQRDELAARLAAIEAQEPVAWIEHELQGTGLRHLHFRRRPNTLRDDVVAPVWTELIARPAPATELRRERENITSGELASGMQSLRTCDWPGNCKHQRLASAAAPERAEPIGGIGKEGGAA